MYATVTHKADITVVVNNEIWDIANAALFAQEAGLHVEYPWDQPDIHHLRRAYDLSVIVGEKDLVEKVVAVLKKDVSHGKYLLPNRQ